MWFFGALLGAVVAANFQPGLAIVGALIGGVLGGLLGARQRQAMDDRLRGIEKRIGGLESRLAQSEAAQLATAAPVAEQTPALAGAAEGPAAAAPPDATGAVAPSRTAEASLANTPEPPAAVAERPLPVGPVAVDETAHAASGGRMPLAGDRSAWLPEWLWGGNLMARAGVVVLFFGVAFLLKYGYQHVHLPVALRLLAVALLAIVLLAVGWRLRRRESYGLALQGGGVGLLYLTIFGALRLFELLPVGLAFALLFAVAVLSAALAVLQDARLLAVLGVAGGFLAPVLASSGGGNHVALFSYYAVLNGGIVVIAWFKAWRVVNLTGFVFTFGVATAFGVLRYSPEIYGSAQLFLILFFLIYVTIPLLCARREAARLERSLDATLIFGVPLVGFGLQVGLVRSFTYASAGSALLLGAFYLCLARTLWARRGEGLRLHVESFLALGVVFTTLAIPLAVDGRWTSAAWALEGAAIVWLGIRQQRLAARVFGVFLQLLAGAFCVADLSWQSSEWPLANSVFSVLCCWRRPACLALTCWSDRGQGCTRPSAGWRRRFSCGVLRGGSWPACTRSTRRWRGHCRATRCWLSAAAPVSVTVCWPNVCPVRSPAIRRLPCCR